MMVRSTDDTPNIIRELGITYPDIVYPVCISVERYSIKGYNISIASNVGYTILMRLGHFDYIMKVDSDTVFPKNYSEDIINAMEKNDNIGICGGLSHTRNRTILHVSDTGRFYSLKCLQEIMRNNGGRYPVMYGHDSYAVFYARYLGYEVFPTETKYYDKRPYRRNMHRWYLSGRFRQMNGLRFLHQLNNYYRDFKHPPYIIGALTGFFSYVVHRVFNPYGTRNKEYCEFIGDWYMRIIIMRYKDRFRKLMDFKYILRRLLHI